MAKSKDVAKCPDCGGEGVVPGRYTDASPIVCATCGGSGAAPADEAAAVVQEVEDGSPVAEAKGAEADGSES